MTEIKSNSYYFRFRAHTADDLKSRHPNEDSTENVYERFSRNDIRNPMKRCKRFNFIFI